MVKTSIVQSWRESPLGPRQLIPCKGQPSGPGAAFAQFNGRSVDEDNDIHYEAYLHREKNCGDNYLKAHLYCELHVECSPAVCKRLRKFIEPQLGALGCRLIGEWSAVAGCGFSVRGLDHEGIDTENVEDECLLLSNASQALTALFDRLDPIVETAVSKYKKERTEEMVKDEIGKITKLLENFGQVILTGAPGTGKTWTAKAIATELAGSENRVKVVQFHPGYDYSDFVMGLKPVLLDGAGREIEGASEEAEVSVSYRWKPGVFKKFADAATADPAYNYVLVIDEINRADLSRVFGELFSLIEKDYRGESKITLPNGEPFSVPAKLYIIGTMNDIDRSVDSMDFALRRRFAWYEVTAESSERIIDAKMAERNADAERIKKSMRILNQYIGGDEKLKVGEREIALGLGAEYQLGGAIFANAVKYRSDEDWPAMLWENHIKVILSEYLRGNRERAVILDALRAEYDKAIA